MKHLVVTLILSLFLSLVSCGGKHNDALVEVDSLLSRHDNAKALTQLHGIDMQSLTRADEAYHALLTTQALCRIDSTPGSDSIINLAVDFFKDNDNEKYARALIYKGEISKKAGKMDLAVECFHTAEDIASRGDVPNLADAKLRLGSLYQDEYLGIKTIALGKYQEALPLYEQLGDKQHEMLCACNIGHLMRGIKGKGDSAVYYLNVSTALARELNNVSMVFANLYSLSEYYTVTRHDYKQGKDIALQALHEGEGIITHPRAHYCLAIAYLNLGQIDSARYYTQHTPAITTPVDSMWYFHTMGEIEKACHNDDLARSYTDRSNAMSASMVINSLNCRLKSIEERYDSQKTQLETQSLRSSLDQALTIIAVIVAVVLALGVLLMRYRTQLRIKQNEYETLTADLDNSLHSLEDMKASLATYESSKASDIKDIIDEQIQMVHQLILWSYEYDEKKFVAKFNSMMALSDTGSASYWKHIQDIANDLHDNILIKAQEQAGGKLSDSEINFLALYSCGFSRTVIMICMSYKSIGTVYNKKVSIAKKLQVPSLDEFLQKHK